LAALSVERRTFTARAVWPFTALRENALMAEDTADRESLPNKLCGKYEISNDTSSAEITFSYLPVMLILQSYGFPLFLMTFLLLVSI
jgi:hypothetical protein